MTEEDLLPREMVTYLNSQNYTFMFDVFESESRHIWISGWLSTKHLCLFEDHTILSNNYIYHLLNNFDFLKGS